MADKINSELTDAFCKALEEGITEERAEKAAKKLRDALTEEIDGLVYEIQESIPEYLTGHVLGMAQNAVEALLAGNEDMMRRYLSCDPYGYTGRDRDHSVIRGTIFEAGPVELRKKIASAHRDLIEQERILDLESQVASLVKQVDARDAEIARLRGRAY